MMDNTLEVYSVKEVAAILKTTRQQVRKMIQNEELPAIKVGRNGGYLLKRYKIL